MTVGTIQLCGGLTTCTLHGYLLTALPFTSAGINVEMNDFKQSTQIGFPEIQ